MIHGSQIVCSFVDTCVVSLSSREMPVLFTLTRSAGYVNGLLPLGVSVVRDCARAPASWLGGGGDPGYWQYDRQRESAVGAAAPGTGSTIGNESQRSVPRLSYHASGSPPHRRR